VEENMSLSAINILGAAGGSNPAAGAAPYLLVGLIGLVLAALVLMILFLRDRSGWWLALFGGSFILYQATLFGFGGRWFGWSAASVPLLLGLSAFGGAGYARAGLERIGRWANLFWWAVMGLGLAAGVAGLFDLKAGDLLAHLAGVVLAALALVFSVVSLKRGFRPARFWLVAWPVFGAGLVLHYLGGRGLLPDDFWIHYADLLGFALGLVLGLAAAVDRRLARRAGGRRRVEARAPDRTEGPRPAQKDQNRTEKRLRRIIDSAPDPSWQSDRAGVIEYAGPALAKALGLAPKALVGRPSASLIHLEDRPRFEADWTRWEAGDHEFFGEYRLASNSGVGPIWVELQGAAVSLPAAEGVVLVGRDVTFRKRGETTLRPVPEPAKTQIDRPSRPTPPESGPSEEPRTFDAVPTESRHQRAFFEHLFESSPEAIVITDPQGRIDLVNASFARLSGFDRDEARGKNVIDLVETSYPRRLLRGPAGQETFSDEIRLRLKSGSLIDTAVSVAPIAVDRIKIGLLITFRDVSRLKRSEAALQRDKRRFQSLVETSPLGVALMGTDGRGEYLNPAFTRMLGYRSEDLASGHNFFSRAFPDPAYRARVLKAWLERLEKSEPGQTRPLKCNVVLADGSTRIVEFRPLTLADGGSVVTVEDVTDQELTFRALRRSEQRLRSVFENAASGLAVINLQYGFERINQLLVEMLGYEAEDLVGRSVLDLTHPEDRAACQAGLENVIKTPGGTDRQEIRYLTRAGAAIWVDQAIRGLKSEQGTLEGLVFIASDITPRKELEQKLHHLATTDPLTGINNRRQQLRLTEKEILRSRRYRQDLSLLVMDVDDFKAVNDRYGHAGGDQILREVAGIAVHELRDSDFLGRIGGEEFAATLVHSDLGQAMTTAERLRRAFERHQFRLDGETIQVTLSIGAAQLDPSGDDLTSLVNRADKAMYLAKSQGKNRVAGRELAVAGLDLASS
jgi:diguanylate cyclase (GGDEF)-like protein/PAS domain S-box-containing protein